MLVEKLTFEQVKIPDPRTNDSTMSEVYEKGDDKEIKKHSMKVRTFSLKHAALKQLHRFDLTLKKLFPHIATRHLQSYLKNKLEKT